MGIEGPEALVAMGEAEVTCQHHPHMAPDGRTGCGPRVTQMASDEGSNWARMAQNGLLDPQFQYYRYNFLYCISIAAQIGPKAEAQGDPSLPTTFQQLLYGPFSSLFCVLNGANREP